VISFSFEFIVSSQIKKTKTWGEKSEFLLKKNEKNIFERNRDTKGNALLFGRRKND